jgi:hypothetical protein
MGPGALLQEVERFADSPDPAAAPALARAAADLADMVGWAAGPIDADGRFAGRLGGLLARLRDAHAAGADPGIAALHDALGALGDAVVRHDRDITESVADDEVLEP